MQRTTTKKTKQNKHLKNAFSVMSNLRTNYCLKLDFPKVDQHTGGKWLIQGSKHRMDNQLQNLELPCGISSRKVQLWHKGIRW